MKKIFFPIFIFLFTQGCSEYGQKFNARTPEQTRVTEHLQKTKPLPKKAELAQTNSVPFETVSLANKIDSAWLKTPTEPFTLGPGDKVEIELVSDPNSTRILTTVGPDGKIYFYLL